MQSLAILGRQPAISLAELISLYPETKQVNTPAAIIPDTLPDLTRLGGTIKLAEIIATLPSSTLITELLSGLNEVLVGHLPEGKAALGISLYGHKLEPRALFAQELTLKKALRARGHNVRIIPGSPLNVAQIQHNQMLRSGADVVVVWGNDNQIYIGITREIQDIEAYAERDHGRPARSAKVGMLPPKLAQIMINLANPEPSRTILDPFCGTGVILQEALLMGYAAYGSDIQAELVAMSEENLAWLRQQHPAGLPDSVLETGDATTHTWRKPIGAVVTEGYLGPALTTQPSPEELATLRADAQNLTLSFLKNLRSQLAPETPIVLTLPAWRIDQRFQRLDILDQILALGYTHRQFLPVQQADLLYSRPDQLVGRELLVLRSI